MTRAAVIGGGVSGLATAALLARGGATVTLFERGDQVGGRAGQLKAGGFTFDTGPSWYLMPEAFEQFFALLGRRVEDYLELMELDPRYRVFFEGQGEDAAESLDVVADSERNWRAFDEMSRGDGLAMREYAARAAGLYRLARDKFLYTTFENPLSPFDREVLPRSPRLLPLLTRSLESAIRRKVAHPRLRQVLGFHAVFLGSSPQRVPSLFSLMSHLDLNEGVKYPSGGFYSVVEALEKVAREEGADIRTGTDVARILVDPERRLATGLILRSGEIVHADLVVSAVDLHHTETQLLTEEFRQHPEHRWRNRKPGVSALLVMAGVKGKLPELSHHNLFFTRDWEANFAAIMGEGGHAPPVPASLYVSKATHSEPGLAPKGKEALVMLVPFRADPAIGATDASREALDALAGQYLDQVGAWAGVPDLRERSTVHAILTPADFAQRFSAWRGSALGLEHTLAQSAFFRPRNRSRRVRNLLYAGASTTPGIGVPICLISAELVAKRLLGDTGSAPTPAPLAPGFLASSRRKGVLGAIARGEAPA